MTMFLPGFRFFLPLAALLLVAACASRADPDSDERIGREAQLDEFIATGETRNCLSISRIRQSRVLSDRTILFETVGREHYVNRLPHRCSQLGFERRFSYSLGGITDLCNTDIIHVITSTGSGASCGLGMFEKLEPKADAGNESQP